MTPRGETLGVTEGEAQHQGGDNQQEEQGS
jgi:hypothetical protein